MGWFFIILGAGLGLFSTARSAENLITSEKYLCTSSGDNAILVAQILDGARVVIGLMMFVLVLWGYLNRKVPDSSNVDKLQYNASALIVLVMFCITLNSLQRSEACSHCVSSDRDMLYDSVRRMIKDESCALQFTQDDFRIPQNYCREEIQERCVNNLPETIYSERCFIYACSSLVHGYTNRYVEGLVSFYLYLAVCMAMLMDENLMYNATVAVALQPPSDSAYPAVKPSKQNEERMDEQTTLQTSQTPQDTGNTGIRVSGFTRPRQRRGTYSRLPTIEF